MKPFLSAQEVNVLRSTHRTIRDRRIADRIKAILSLNSGFDYIDITRILLLDESTLRRYIKRFKNVGMAGLMESRYVGGVGKLTLVQEASLSDFLSKNIFLTAKEIVAYVFKEYEVKYTVTGMTKLLHRLGFSYKSQL